MKQFLSVLVESPKPKLGEIEKDFQQRLKNYLKSLSDELKKNYSGQFAIGFKGHHEFQLQTECLPIFTIGQYGAVIPMIQNTYAVEAGDGGGWTFGFKYKSGVFEYFNYTKKKDAQAEYKRLLDAITTYWASVKYLK